MTLSDKARARIISALKSQGAGQDFITIQEAGSGALNDFTCRQLAFSLGSYPKALAICNKLDTGTELEDHEVEAIKRGILDGIIARQINNDSGGSAPIVVPDDAVGPKSVIFDVYDNWSGSELTIRNIDFHLDGVSLGLTSDDYTAYATTGDATNVFDSSQSRTGADTAGWVSSNTSSQRIIVVFNTVQVFDEIVVNNGHNSGSEQANGAEWVEINISDDEITDTTFGAAISNSTLLNLEVFDRHVPSDVEEAFTVWEHGVLADENEFFYATDHSGGWQVTSSASRFFTGNWDTSIPIAGDPIASTQLLLRADGSDATTIRRLDGGIPAAIANGYTWKLYARLAAYSAVQSGNDGVFHLTSTAISSGSLTLNQWSSGESTFRGNDGYILCATATSWASGTLNWGFNSHNGGSDGIFIDGIILTRE